MGSRRLNVGGGGGGDDDDEDHRRRRRKVSWVSDFRSLMKRKLRSDDEEEEAEEVQAGTSSNNRGRPRPCGVGVRRNQRETKAPNWSQDEQEEEDDDDDEDDEEEEGNEQEEKAKPIGDVVGVSWKNRQKRLHYSAFEYDNTEFELEDTVLVTPEAPETTKPFVAIIKEITQTSKGSIKVICQWFYRPEEAEKEGGGHWESQDARELFYSSHCDPVSAESVMHKCVVHYIPLNKKWPLRSEYPGFIVQKIYDTTNKRLRKLTNKGCLEGKHDIEALIEKTQERIGELPDVDTENTFKRVVAQDLLGADGAGFRSHLYTKPGTAGNCVNNDSKYISILREFKVLTGDASRDKWLDKLLQKMQLACDLKEYEVSKDKRMLVGCDTNQESNGNKEAETSIGVTFNGPKTVESIYWPDVAVGAITALERAAYKASSSDFQRYNQKMRQLEFNLKAGSKLAKRLLYSELDAVTVVKMSPDELKDGLTAEERATKEPEETKQLQMTDARCSRCSEKKVGIAEIIQAGGRGNRYQLECIACGYTWYASQDAFLSLTVDAPRAARNVGAQP